MASRAAASRVGEAGWPRATIEEPAKTSAPVKAWAVIGALVLAFQFYVWISWIASDHFTPVETGPTPMPGWMSTLIAIYVPLGILGFLFCAYWFWVRPWRRERRATTDGLLALMFLFLYFQDPLINYFVPHGSYNSHILNFGSWTAKIPGWESQAAPGAAIPEPFLFSAPLYVYALLPGIILANWVMRRTKARYPKVGPLGLVGVCLAFLFVFDVLMELVWLRLGFYFYGGAWESLTLFHGKYYQFPLYEAAIWCVGWTAFACLRYFKNDKGQTIAERGVERLRVSPGGAYAVRFLAIFGCGSVLFFALYNVPIQFFALKSDPWPKEIQERSYMTDYLCGPETNRACPGPGVPNPRERSARFDPAGNVFIPEGTPPPGSETVDRFRTTP